MTNAPGETIPKTVSQRLSLYLRVLQELAREEIETVSSQALALRLEIQAAQVRKDLAYFGHFGSPGVGYRVEHLISQVKRILGTDRGWDVALVGAGRLGSALVRYGGFAEQGFRITAVFDADIERHGTQVDSLTVEPMSALPGALRDRGISLAIVAVPAAFAQSVADELVAAGIKGILNFAPLRLSLPESVSLVAVDLAVQLEQLSYMTSLRQSEPETQTPARPTP
jgi:redox-sensing transcriptional repressor